MQKFIFVIASILVLFAVDTFACFETEEQFEEAMTYYYQNNEPNKLICGLEYYSDGPLFQNKKIRMPIAHFYAAAFNKSPEFLNKLYEQMSATGSDKAKIFALHVFWVINSEKSLALLNHAEESWNHPEISRIANLMKTNKPKDLLNIAPQTPGDLDNLWATFFASGDPLAIEQIASTLPLIENGHGVEIIIGGSAKWSLTSNYRQHSIVKKIVQELSKKTDTPYHSSILTVIESAEKTESGT